MAVGIQFSFICSCPSPVESRAHPKSVQKAKGPEPILMGRFPEPRRLDKVLVWEVRGFRKKVGFGQPPCVV